MTEVPEHLLRRAKERRAALGGGDGGSEPPATPGEAPGTGAAASAVEPVAAAPAPAPVEEPPKPLPPYVVAAQRRARVPKYAIPVLAALPLWALVYAGTLVKPASALDPELALGQRTYAAACSGCHGAAGEGGTGRPLGTVLETFPDKADHLLWIMNGSPAIGTPYGDPNRPGGQRISGSDGYTTRMPAFKNSLSKEEIAAVARYEREVIGGGEAAPSTEDDLNPTPSEGSPAENGTTDTGDTTNAGSGTDQAQTQGGDVGGNNPEGSNSNAKPSTGGSGTNQTSETGPSADSKSGGGTGSGTGGDTTSTTAPS